LSNAKKRLDVEEKLICLYTTASLWPVHTSNKVSEKGNKLLPETATKSPFPATLLLFRATMLPFSATIVSATGFYVTIHIVGNDITLYAASRYNPASQRDSSSKVLQALSIDRKARINCSQIQYQHQKMQDKD